MRKKSFMLRTLAAGLAVFSSVAAMGQQGGPDWLQDVSDRIQLHGYAQGGFNYTHTDDADVNTFEIKRTLFWANAQITDRVSFLFMHDFNSVVQEYYMDYRFSNNKALTVRLDNSRTASPTKILSHRPPWRLSTSTLRASPI